MAIALNTVKAPTGGTVVSAPALPLASDPSAPNLSPVAKPTLQPNAPAPLPLAGQPATPQPAQAPTPPTSQPSTQPVGPTSQAPSTPAIPTPYQTSDPLAFMPTDSSGNLPRPSSPVNTDPLGSQFSPFGTPPAGTTAAPPGSTVTESAPSFVAPQAATPMATPDPQQLDIGSLFGGSTPTAPGASSAAPAATTSSNGAVSLTPTTPDSSLTNYTISPGELADRFGIAKDKISDWNAIEEPMFDHTIQSISQNRAGAGQIGSGMMRGAFRDAANTYDTQRLAAQRGFLNDALGGSIDDAFKSVGVAQQQQQQQQSQQAQGFNQNMTLQQMQDSEQGQQWTQLMQSVGFNADQMQKAFDNAYKAQTLSDDETGQSFSRAMQQAIFGAQGNPADIEEWLAGLYALPQPSGVTG